jgi:hypothetical protein
MTRFETTIAVAAAALIAVAYSPALAQRGEKGQAYIEFDGGTRQVTAEVKGGKGPKATKGGPAVATRAEPAKPVEPTFTANGGFQSSREKAREDAIRAAVDALHEYLLQQDPPITRMPTTKFVRKMLLNDQEKIVPTDEPVATPDGRSEIMYRATVAVKVEPEHVRELRSQERSSEALWVLAGLAGLAVVAAGFFRIDAWTKGYLTSWLALGTVGASSLLAGLWWWAR